jgi:cell division protein ZapE
MHLFNLQDSFKEFCKKNKFEKNSQQIEIINLLDKFLNPKKIFFSSFFKKKNKLCFYLYGNIGVGKTMLLNFIYDQLKIKKHRAHFNEFMISFHDFRHDKEDDNSIRSFVKKLKRQYELIYLDEFQVTNIVDAMILGKLFETIFLENIKILITTNIKPNDLYKNGLQREQFLPFISIIKNHSIQKELSLKDDYRLKNSSKLQKIYYPLNEGTSFKINQIFREFTRGKKKELKTIITKGRSFIIDNFYSGIARFNFKDLCDKNLGAEDYINIANICNYIFIEEIPIFNESNSNQQQRFITLIDILYEKKIFLTLSLANNLNHLGTSKKHSETFKRTLSRLFEMTKKY